MEDLVQDGLITLYMEANNVEEYLQSARQTRVVQRTSSIPGATDPLDLTPMQEGHAHIGEEAVFGGEGEVGGESVQRAEGQQRKAAYQPCTIPQRRDCTSIPHPAEGEGEGEGEEPSAATTEEVSGQEVLHH